MPAIQADEAENIQQNEMGAQKTCQHIAEAEEVFHRGDYDGDGILEYAQVIHGRAAPAKVTSVDSTRFENPSDAERAVITKNITLLADDDFTVREQATTALIALGPKAYGMVSTAARTSRDAEAILRCEKITRSILLSLAPGAVLKLKYRVGLDGSDDQRQFGIIDQQISDAEVLLGTDPAVAKAKGGYLFRILTRQGEAGPGGKRDFVVGTDMTLGYAILAFPKEYGVTGNRCFLISSNGVTLQRDFKTKKGHRRVRPFVLRIQSDERMGDSRTLKGEF